LLIFYLGCSRGSRPGFMLSCASRTHYPVVTAPGTDLTTFCFLPSAFRLLPSHRKYGATLQAI
jgi:hypothetical protein